MRVLIAANGLSTDALAARAAAARPWPAGSQFCVMSVLDPYPLGRTPLSFDRAKEAVLRNLESVAAELKRAGWNAAAEVLFGSPRRGIGRFARDWAADLVMVGCNDVSDLTRLFLGSTAQSVLRHAPCSVEVVRKLADESSLQTRGMKILVASDGSEYSLAAARSVANRPWPAGSEARIISAAEFHYLQNPPYPAFVKMKDLAIASIEEARKAVAGGLKALSGTALGLSGEVPSFEDRAYRVILHEAETWGADMIVLGSHGRSGFDRIVMGSVSEAVALHAKCSVEVIREPALEKTGEEKEREDKRPDDNHSLLLPARN